MLHFVGCDDDLHGMDVDMMDELDRRLLALLRADSREPVASLAA
jgi:hypothetical protein